MKKGLSLMLTLVFVFSLMMVSGLAGCGDAGLDPTDDYIDNGAINESECKEACDKVASCMTGDVAASGYADDCKLNCNQSGHFEVEALECIKKVTNCDDLFNCGFKF